MWNQSGASLLVLLSSSLGLTAGCTGGGAGASSTDSGTEGVAPCHPDGGVAIPSSEQRAGCAAQAEVLCTRLSTCYPDGLVRATGEEPAMAVAECRQLRTALCEQALQLVGVEGDAAGLHAYASELQRMFCPNLALELLPGSRYTTRPGRRPPGQSCQIHDQCASNLCDLREGHGICLKDEPAQPAGTPCAVEDSVYRCRGPGLICDIATVTCVAIPREGEPCPPRGLANNCVDNGLECLAGTCRRALLFDEACDPAADLCSTYVGLVCNPATRRCTSTATRAEGQTCGGITMEGSCAGGLYCLLDPGTMAIGSFDGPGRCARHRRRGESCDALRMCAYALDCTNAVCAPRTFPACR
jgi:hypothetical protein